MTERQLSKCGERTRHRRIQIRKAMIAEQPVA